MLAHTIPSSIGEFHLGAKRSMEFMGNLRGATGSVCGIAYRRMGMSPKFAATFQIGRASYRCNGRCAQAFLRPEALAQKQLSSETAKG